MAGSKYLASVHSVQLPGSLQRSVLVSPPHHKQLHMLASIALLHPKLASATAPLLTEDTQTNINSKQ